MRNEQDELREKAKAFVLTKVRLANPLPTTPEGRHKPLASMAREQVAGPRVPVARVTAVEEQM